MRNALADSFPLIPAKRESQCDASGLRLTFWIPAFAATSGASLRLNAISIFCTRCHRPPKVVAFTHHVGCFTDSAFSAAAASSGVPNNPKQVAPEPDMRASAQPGAFAQAPPARRRSTAAARWRAAPDRSSARPGSCISSRALVELRERRVVERRGGRRRSLPAGEDRLGRQRHARIDQHRRQRRQRKRRRQIFADAAHDARARIEADRHVGAGRARRRIEIRIVARRCRWPRREGAAPPPHRPSRRRARPRPAAVCRGRKRPSARPGRRAASARAALSTRLSSPSPAAAALGPLHRQRQIAATAKSSSGRRNRRTPPGFQARDSRRRGAPSTRSVKLTLAGACSASENGRRQVSTAVAGLLGLGGIGRGRGVIGQPGFELVLDLRQVFRLGLQVAARASIGSALPAPGRPANRRRRDDR